MPFNYVNSDFIDEIALANIVDDTARRNRRAQYVLRHKPTGKYLKSSSQGYWSRYQLTADDPSIKPMSTMTLWLKRISKPEDWEIVPMRYVPGDVAASDKDMLFKYLQALGLLSTLKGDLLVNVDDPVGMARQIEQYVHQLEAAAKWHELPELPPGPGAYIAFWKEDGCWTASYWPQGVSAATGEEYEEGEDGVTWEKLGNWVTPDGSVRTDPIAWRHLPPVPDKYVGQLRMFAEEAEDAY